jgi:hypothetical protein
MLFSNYCRNELFILLKQEQGWLDNFEYILKHINGGNYQTSFDNIMLYSNEYCEQILKLEQIISNWSWIYAKFIFFISLTFSIVHLVNLPNTVKRGWITKGVSATKTFMYFVSYIVLAGTVLYLSTPYITLGLIAALPYFAAISFTGLCVLLLINSLPTPNRPSYGKPWNWDYISRNPSEGKPWDWQTN